MQGLAFLVTFGAIAKSDWPRAAIEREGGKDQSSFHRPLTLTLSREGRGDNAALRAICALDPRFARMTADWR